jgi:DNA-binding XRE family transcriptional regulator
MLPEQNAQNCRLNNFVLVNVTRLTPGVLGTKTMNIIKMHNMRMRGIISAIRAKREQLNYSQEYMAYRMEVGQNCYSKIELGHTKLTLDRLFAICAILEMDVNEVIGFAWPMGGRASGF